MAYLQTNILALPLAHLTIETGNNENWIDSIRYETPTEQQVDLRGINFEMQIRRMPAANEVVLNASTNNKWIFVGSGANYGSLIISVPKLEMERHFAGAYVGDIRAFDERYHRRIVTIDLTIVQGITQSRTFPELVWPAHYS